jgi:hypothetical protein
VYIGHGETAAYPTAFVHNAQVEFYDTNPINTISGASFTTRSGSPANWYNGVTVPAGDYLVEIYMHVQSLGTGYAGHCLTGLICAINSPTATTASADYVQFPRYYIVRYSNASTSTISFTFSINATGGTTDTPIRFSECFGLLIRKIV